MTLIVEAIVDGDTLRCREPIALPTNTRVRVTIETSQDVKPGNTTSFLTTARRLNLDGPPDWSENIDKYLYGVEHDNGA